MSEIVIRKLQKEDIEPLSAIEQDSFSMPWSAEEFENLLSRDYCYYLVALWDGQIVGGCGMTCICGEGNIDNVVVAKEYRNKQIATKMLQRILNDGDAMGMTAYTLEVRVSNAPAIRVYEKLGFVSEGIRPRFYEKPVEDAMIMWKR